MTREIELKLEMHAADVAKLSDHPLLSTLSLGSASTERVRSVYFDTSDLSLASRGFALRVRRVGDAWVQTLKSREAGTAGLFDRAEHEAAVPSEQPDLSRVADPGLRATLGRELADESLEAIIETDVQRTSRRLRSDGSELQLDLDVGEVKTRAGSGPICELELELVEGDPKALYDVALELAQTIAFRPSMTGKVDRGFAQLTGERPSPRKGERRALPAKATLEQVLSTGLAGCLEQILLNELPAREGVDPEGVHQMRIGVRRLRSALSLFSSMLPAEPTRALRQELSWLANALGAARDLDVFLQDTIEPLAERFAASGRMKGLRDDARDQRADAYRQLRELLDSPRYTRLVLGAGRFIACRVWRDQPLSEKSAPLFLPARPQSRSLLDRRWRKARKLSKHVAEAPIDEKHRLRVMLKKLRYNAELLGAVHPRRRATLFSRRISELQDVLGHLNDLATADRLLEQLVERAGHSTERDRAVGFVAGWTAYRAEREVETLARSARAFARAEPFWSKD